MLYCPPYLEEAGKPMLARLCSPSSDPATVYRFDAAGSTPAQRRQKGPGVGLLVSLLGTEDLRYSIRVDVGRNRGTVMDTGGGIGQVVSWGNRLSKTPYLASLCPEIKTEACRLVNVASWTHEGENREQEHERCCIRLESDEPDRFAGRVRSSLIVAR